MPNAEAGESNFDQSDFGTPILRSSKVQKSEPAVLRTPRLFLREPGWKVVLKVGSERLFCYMTQPGETYYHRIVDGEIHLVRDDEKICLPCAERRGLLAFEPKRLREPSADINFLMDQIGNDDLLQILVWEDDSESEVEHD